MDFTDIEKCFNRACHFCFSRKKLVLVFPVLVLCGILAVLCRALALDAGGWIAMSLVFLPILLSSGILLSLGVLLVRIYYHEVKGLPHSFRKIVKSSWQVVLGTFYVSIPPILVYLLLWILLGIFMLFKEIPGIGTFIGIVLAFGPFLLILSFIVLCICNLALLFFVTPPFALNAHERPHLSKVKHHLFSHLVFFFLALLPIAVVAGILSLAAIVTNTSYLVGQHTLSLALKWFFIMIPFCAFLTPAVVFYFNFAAEAYNLLYRKHE